MTVKLVNRVLNFIVLAGVALIISAFLTGKILGSFYDTAKETSAVITSMQGDGDMDVYISYMIGHKEYQCKLGSYDDSMEIGQSVNIFYDPENPKRVKWAGYKSPCKTLYATGFVFFLGGIGLRIWNEVTIRKRKRKRREARAARAARAARNNR